MKSGIELIAEERQEQIAKHQRTIIKDVKLNTDYQLAQAASLLLQKSFPGEETGLDNAFRDIVPLGWNKQIYQKMFDKDYKVRLVIAGALIAAEIDRLNNINQEP